MVSLDPVLHEAFKRRGVPPVDKLTWAQLFSKYDYYQIPLAILCFLYLVIFCLHRVFEEMRPSYSISRGSHPPIIR